MKKTELTPFQGYLDDANNTVLQSIIVDEATKQLITIIYQADYYQLSIHNSTTQSWSLSTDLRFVKSGGMTTYYQMEFSIPPNYLVYFNPTAIIDPNLTLRVNTIGDALYINDLSLVNVELERSYQWQALLKRMITNTNRLLLNGDELSTLPSAAALINNLLPGGMNFQPSPEEDK